MFIPDLLIFSLLKLAGGSHQGAYNLGPTTLSLTCCYVCGLWLVFKRLVFTQTTLIPFFVVRKQYRYSVATNKLQREEIHITSETEQCFKSPKCSSTLIRKKHIYSLKNFSSAKWKGKSLHCFKSTGKHRIILFKYEMTFKEKQL